MAPSVFEVTNRGEAVSRACARCAREIARYGMESFKAACHSPPRDVAVEKNVGVRINEAGEDGGFGQVEHFGACRRRGVWA